MIQPRTQTAEYWEEKFTLEQTDIDQLYNHLLEVEKPQTIAQMTRVVIAHRVASEIKEVERKMAGRTIYQPANSHAIGDKLVFPIMGYAHGNVVGTRAGFNPEVGEFNVIQVEIDEKTVEFASELQHEHVLNQTSESEADLPDEFADIDVNNLVALYGNTVGETIAERLTAHEEFIRLSSSWFVKSLMAEVNIGHLHLAEAVLEMSGGGPLPTDEIRPHLDMDAALDPEVLDFSLNYSLLNDNRFDEVAPKGNVAWFLHRLEPDGVKETPERLQYKSIPHDRALLSPQLLLLERELDDEWSDLEAADVAESVEFVLTFPHRWAGTMPLSSQIRPLLPLGQSPRQQLTFIDEETQEEIGAWVVKDGRYIYGLSNWYEKNAIPIGGYVHLTRGETPDKLLLGYQKRRTQREWIRLATAADNRIQFDLKKRGISCGFDDLMVVGTDVTAAIDALFRRAESHQRTISSLLAELFDALAPLAPQNSVHAKTLYSAMNMLRRVPPGPLFAELVRHPAFLQVGDHYWQLDREKWRESN